MIVGGPAQIVLGAPEATKHWAHDAGCIVLWFSPDREDPRFPPDAAPWRGEWHRVPHILAGFVRSFGEGAREFELPPLGTAWVFLPQENPMEAGLLAMILKLKPKSPV